MTLVPGLRVRHLLPALGRVPHDLATEGSSGLVRIALEIARAQVIRGHAVDLYGWRPGAPARTYDLQGVTVHATPGWRWARTSRIDARMVLPLVASSALSSVAAIAHVHSEPHLLLAPRARARILHYQTPIPTAQPGAYGWLVRRATRVVCCSDFVRRQFLARVDYPADRTIVVHGGVDLCRFQIASPELSPSERLKWGINPGETAILYPGAVVPEKGLVELLCALHRLRSTEPELAWRLLIAGDAELWRTIESADGARPGPDAYTARARELSRGLPVSWLGVVPEQAMPGLYAAVDLVTCPSVWEDPFPTVNLEAMAAGKPVVASRVGGVPEAVDDGITGVLVEPGDDVALAAALSALIADPVRRRQLGEAGRARSGRFTSAAAAARLDELYQEALQCA